MREKNKICQDCGAASRKKYCQTCASRRWRKSPGYKKNKCAICGEPCNDKFCSKKCSGKDKEKNYTAICKFCGKEFIFHKISYQKRGQMIYCSTSCQNSIYKIDHNFFMEHKNVKEIYQVMGFLFASGYINSIVKFTIYIYSTKKNLEEFKKIVNTNYKITSAKGRTNLDKYKLQVRSKEWINYLYSIGFSNSLTSHTFPTILDEYKMDFIKGYISSDMCEIYNKVIDGENTTIHVIKAKSYSIAREIASITNGELLTKNLEFCCIIKNINFDE